MQRELNAERVAANGWDDEPRGHDYQQAQWLWCLGFRQGSGLTGWRLRLLTKYGRPGYKAYHGVYATLRVYRAFCETQERMHEPAS